MALLGAQARSARRAVIFETLGKMLPRLRGSRVTRAPLTTTLTMRSTRSRRWSGWGSPVPWPINCDFGTSVESRIDAGAIAASLLSSPPFSKASQRGTPTCGDRQPPATSFHADGRMGIVALRDRRDPELYPRRSAEVALARCRKFELPPIPSVIHDPIVRGASHQMFFRLLAEYGEHDTGRENPFPSAGSRHRTVR